MRVDADALTLRPAHRSDHSRARREIARRVLGVDAAFDGAAFAPGFAARQAQPPPRGDRNLRRDDVDAAHGLGDRVLHLDARIHLEEEELLARGVDQEFHRARAAIFQSHGEAHRGLVQALCAAPPTSPGAGVSSMIFW